MLTETIWGADFASDDFFSIVRIRTWSDLAEGEGFRFISALCARTGDLAADLRRRVLARAVDVEARARGCGLAQVGDDAAWLRELVECPQARTEVVDLATMARFAFLTGLHPAYLWPQAEILTYWGATAAWLGELSRHGRAHMPPEVAEYLGDALACDNGKVVLRDLSLAGLAPDAILPQLYTAARNRRAGRATVARWRDRRTAVGSASALVARLFGPRTRRGST